MPLTSLTERDFEDDVEQMLGDAGWTTARATRLTNAQMAAGYDRHLALDTRTLLGFIQETQPDEWRKVADHYGPRAETEFLRRLVKVLEPKGEHGGLLNALRHGFTMAPNKATFRLCYIKPASTLNPDAERHYRANRFTVVRQLRYGTLPTDMNDSIDVVLMLNGIPVVTIELKNPLSGQTTADAVAQYKRDRSPKETLLKPNRRSLVHFAVDPDTAQMTTWLRGQGTTFLPFNQGNGTSGGGNPANPAGYHTEYLFRDVLTPDSLLDIIARFIQVRTDPDSKALKAVIFPRYHQLDAVRQLVADARTNGAGHKYLIQHSAGSGKSNTIAWLAHHLHSLHDADDHPVFDSVIVLTDRRNLDSQLSATVNAIDHTNGVVRTITEKDRSAGLRDAINSGARIITSTIQKFPYIATETRVPGKRFAVIIDEAHSSQSGTSHAKMRAALKDSGDEWDAQDELAAELAAQGPVDNVSFFAFTATPKPATLEAFGTRDTACPRDEHGQILPRPYHLYSMRQAIEEGFILDVLENYTCFETYFQLVKTISDDPRFAQTKANQALHRIVAWNTELIDRKAEIIVEHFMSDVEGLLGHRAKAMVVASSRQMALELYRAMNRCIAAHRYRCETMIAFSGELGDGEDKVTEAGLNGVKESETTDVFDRDEKRIIVVANKLQTGFDQPKLCAMYVDKELSGVAAVQTLSRLNRTCSIPGKRTFVVDFANDTERIRQSFAPYYETTALDAVTDPNVVYDLKERLDGFDVYTDAEVERVSEIYLDTDEGDGSALRRMETQLAHAVDRWKALDATRQREFKALLKKLLRSYSFITQLMALGDEDLHRFFIYAGLLIKELFVEASPDVDLRDKVEVEYLRVEDKGTQAIALESDELHNGGANAGVTREEEEDYLSVLVARMNEAFGTQWDDADHIMRALNDKMLEDDEFVAMARANSLSEVRAVFPDRLQRALLDLILDGEDMSKAFGENSEVFMRLVNDSLLPALYRRINEE